MAVIAHHYPLSESSGVSVESRHRTSALRLTPAREASLAPCGQFVVTCQRVLEALKRRPPGRQSRSLGNTLTPMVQGRRCREGCGGGTRQPSHGTKSRRGECRRRGPSSSAIPQLEDPPAADRCGRRSLDSSTRPHAAREPRRPR